MKNIVLLIFFVGISMPLFAQIPPSPPPINVAGMAGDDISISKNNCANNPTPIGNPSNSYCSYQWSPSTGLSAVDVAIPDACPSQTTTYTLHTTDNDGNLYISTVTVFVSEMKVNVYRPQVMGVVGNAVMGGTQITNPFERGAMTFVNLDNDDEDNQFDNNDNEVTGGDDELIKVEIKIEPNTTGKIVIKTDGGGNYLKIWKDEQKTLGQDYTFGDTLDLPQGGNNSITLWIEGILAHSHNTTPRTQLFIENTKYAFSGVIIPITVLGIESITFEGVGNGFNPTGTPRHTSDVLDTDDVNFDTYAPNNQGYFPSLKSQRVFIGNRYFNNQVDTLKRDSVRVNIKLSVAPIESINIFIKAFDIDDPYTDPDPSPANPKRFIDPNDTGAEGTYDGATVLTGGFGSRAKYDKNNDNRGVACMEYDTTTLCNKEGMFSNYQPRLEVNFLANNKERKVKFIVSHNPGDNYRIVANADVDFIDRLRNQDEADGLAIVDPKIGNGNIGQVRDENGLLDKYMSNVLTVWRLLHIENDVMTNPDFTINSREIIINDFIGIDGKNITEINSISPMQDADDYSKTYQNNFSSMTFYKGRFENGHISVLAANPDDGYAQLCDIGDILGNSKYKVSTKTGKVLNFINGINGTNILKYELLDANGNQYISGTVEQFKKSGTVYSWELNLPSGVSNLNNYNGGTLKIGGDEIGVQITSVTQGSNFLTTNKLRIIAYVHDDDLYGEVSPSSSNRYYDDDIKLDLSMTRDVYQKAYLYVDEMIDPSISNKVSLGINVGRTEMDNIGLNSKSRQLGQKLFWMIQVCKSFQPQYIRDRDSDGEVNNNTDSTTVPLGMAWGPTSNTSIAHGGFRAFIFMEVIREDALAFNHNKNDEIKITTAHEIGHLLGLGHGDATSEEAAGEMEVMGAKLNMKAKIIINRQINFIRNRIQSPGKGY